MKKVLSLIITIAVVVSSFPFASAEEISSALAPKEITYNLKLPTVKYSKNISDALSEKISDALVLFVGSPIAYVFGNIDRVDGQGGLNSLVNGDQGDIVSGELGLSPTITDGRTILPLRFISNSLGWNVEWDDESKTAKISKDGKEILFTLNSNIIKTGNTDKVIDVPAQIIRNRMFVPFRALAEELGYKVLWDDRGLIVMSKENVFDKETDSLLLDELVESFYTYSSADVQHPYKYRCVQMVDYADRDNLRKYTLDEIIGHLGDAYTMDEAEYLKKLQESVSKQAYLDKPPTNPRKNSLRFAACYIKTGDDFFARRSILTMYYQAKNYDNVPKEIDPSWPAHAVTLFGQLYFIPQQCVAAYDILYYSDQWDVLSEELGVDVRREIEAWFKKVLDDYLDFFGEMYVQNTASMYLMGACYMSMVMNEPDYLHRLLNEMVSLQLSGYEFYADGMWHEGSLSYQNDVLGANSESFWLFKYWQDPLGYSDDVSGIRLNYKSLKDTFPMLSHAEKILSGVKFPNGKNVPIQDTHVEASKDISLEIKEENLKNIELYHFGHYGLTHGDTQDAQQVNLAIYPVTEGWPYSSRHHGHYGNLPINLWGSGMEMLVDMGYVSPTSLVQYQMSLHPNFHNAGFIWVKDENYRSEVGMTSRADTLAYDSGAVSGKKVQLVEGSVLGADTPQNTIDVKRRLVMMIETEGNRAYTFDLQRLRGGDAHENYLISGENERTKLETDLEMEEHPDTTMKDLLQENKYGYSYGREYLTNPKSADGTQDFDFSWTGEETETTINVFMNGVPDSEVYFSTYPSYREAKGQKAKEFDFPGWHFYRRRKVSQSDTTQYSAVYETTKKEQEMIVDSVKWVTVPDADAMTCAAIVDMGENEDIIYISDDYTTRQVEDISFCGKVAVLRRNKATKDVVWGYIYGEGSIECAEYSLKGKENYNFKVLKAYGEISENPTNYIKVKGTMPNNTQDGTIVHIKFPDRSGWALKLKNVDQSVIYTEQHPAFKVTENGSEMLFFPNVEYDDGAYTRVGLTDTQGYALPIRTFRPRGYDEATWAEVIQPTFKEN